MATVDSPVVAPAPGWARRLPRDERLFLWLIVGSALAMSVFVLGWLAFGGQNVPTDGYRTTPKAFSAQVSQFMEKYGEADGRAHVPPGVDAYVMGARYVWYPDLVLEVGEPYRIWLSAADTLHGYSIVGKGQNINLEVAPGHAYGVTFTPDEPGEYLIVCNEYCGLGHQMMLGRIFVER